MMESYTQSPRENHEIITGKYNREHEGDLCFRQLSESVEQFIERLPPQLLYQVEDLSAVSITNPRAIKISDAKGGIDRRNFHAYGIELLAQFMEYTKRAERNNPGSAKSNITRLLTPQRKNFINAVHELAKQFNFTTGKWILFVTSANLSSVWGKVCHATVEGELGYLTQISLSAMKSNSKANGGNNHPITPFTLTIHTADFTDEQDICRVWKSLDSLGILPVSKIDRNRVQYIADAYAHINLKPLVRYGIPLHVYSGRDMQ